MIHRQYAATLAAGVLALVIAFGPVEAQQQAPVRIPKSVLQRYVGEYDQDGSRIMITMKGDTLFREIPGQRLALQPISATRFRMGPVFTAEFVVDGAGGVTQVVSSGTVEFRLPRRGSRVAPPPSVAPVRVPRSVLERYAGTYEYLPGQMSRTDLRILVRLRGDTLTRSFGGKQESVLLPTSATRFRVAGTSLEVEFVVDEAGVTQVLGSGFQQLLARLQSPR